MVKINKIYTRSGDAGETHLVGGKRVKKNSKRVSAYGEIDELNSFLGWARVLADKSSADELAKQLSIIQNELFDLGAYLASIPGEKYAAELKIDETTITEIEK